jgi:hypothetical protein
VLSRAALLQAHNNVHHASTPARWHLTSMSSLSPRERQGTRSVSTQPRVPILPSIISLWSGRYCVLYIVYVHCVPYLFWNQRSCRYCYKMVRVNEIIKSKSKKSTREVGSCQHVQMLKWSNVLDVLDVCPKKASRWAACKRIRYRRSKPEDRHLLSVFNLFNLFNPSISQSFNISTCISLGPHFLPKYVLNFIFSTCCPVTLFFSVPS